MEDEEEGERRVQVRSMRMKEQRRRGIGGVRKMKKEYGRKEGEEKRRKRERKGKQEGESLKGFYCCEYNP